MYLEGEILQPEALRLRIGVGIDEVGRVDNYPHALLVLDNEGLTVMGTYRQQKVHQLERQFTCNSTTFVPQFPKLKAFRWVRITIRYWQGRCVHPELLSEAGRSRISLQQIQAALNTNCHS